MARSNLMTTSIAQAILLGTHKLRHAGVPEPRREAGSLLAHVIARDQSFIITHAEDALADEDLDKFSELLAGRAAGMPLQYLVGRQEFFGLEFEVTPDVLIPRPETELLVENALNLLLRRDAAVSICDVGTGSGCIVITLLHELPNARAIALDLSPAAIAVAKRNAERHSVSGRLEFLVSDCFSGLRDTDGPFDLLVSNPPYVPAGHIEGLQREVRDYEPQLALEAGPDGLSVIRRLLTEAGNHLNDGGHFLFEIGFDQGEAVRRLIEPMAQSGDWKLLDIYPDLQGIPRTVALQKLS